MSNPIVQHRRGTTAEWLLYKDIILKEGELSVEFCDNGTTLIKIGDGVTSYENLKPISGSEEELKKIIADYQQADTVLAAAQAETQEQVKKIETSFNNAVIVDGLEYIENKLYLKSGDKTVGNYVEIVGGGGGGTGSYIDYDLVSNTESTTMTIGSNSSCYVDFTFTSIKMPQERPTGNFTFSVLISGVVKGTVSLPQGRNVQDISEYLNVGQNDVTIRCTDIYGNSMDLNYVVTVVELSITSTFNDSLIYNSRVDFKYTPFGVGIEKTIHFIVDRDEISTATIVTSGEQQTQTLTGLDHGAHSIEVYSSATIGGEYAESDHISYEFICVEQEAFEPIIASQYVTSSVKQGDLVSIPYMVYDPLNLSCEVLLTVKDSSTNEIYDEQLLLVDRRKQYWNTRDFPVGDISFIISYKDIRKEHKIIVSESDINVTAVTNDLELFLSSANRSNTELNPAVWEFNGITTTFNDVNWKSNGWLSDGNGDTCLRLSGDARATINFKPFEQDLKTYGKTIEFEFAVRDVNDRDAVVISCFSNGIGFKATADTAFLNSEETQVSCNYKEEERVRISFTIEQSTSGTRFLSTYLDGVLSGITRYSENDNFQQSSAVSIELGSELCGLDLYSIRVYGTALTDNQILQNYIADTSEIITKATLYNSNNIYDDYTGRLAYSKIKDKIPTIIFIGKMPTYKGDKKKNSVRMIFEDPQHPELNFDEILAQIDVQGTSSAGYVRKNWKTKHNVEHVHMEDELAAKVFCIKVDYAEATGTHNTQNANLIETFYTSPIPPMNADNFPSDMTDAEKEDISKVRTTIAGFPVVIFHLDTDDMDLIKSITKNELSLRKDLVFSSKGNFNYDKDAEDVFAFNDTYDVECWEFLKNEDPQSFLTPWPETPLDYWEARYHPRLGELEDLQDNKDDVAAKALGDEMLSRFKTMYEWVHSTARGYYNGQPQASGATLESTFIDPKDKKEYTHDTDEYRLAKFRTEFEQYFDLHYAAVYYVYTFFALMVDQRAKNMFLTYWRDNAYGSADDTINPGKWYPYFYDNDTSYGISNKGHLDFDYYHQDTDSINGSNVFNGANSVLWRNFADAFQSEIESTYRDLRNSGKLSYDKIIDRFITQGSDKWSASVYNEDADYKYISVDSDVVEGQAQDYPYLFQVRGNGAQHLKYFVENRIKFCDSKWKCADYLDTKNHTARVNIYNPITSNDYQECRLWEEQGSQGEQPAYYDTYRKIKDSTVVRAPSAAISIKPYSRMYYGVQYGAPSGDDVTKGIISKLATDTEQFIDFNHTDVTQLNDFETTIYGAKDISSLGDLSNLYAKEIIVTNAVKLTELIVGCRDTGPNGEEYYNPNLTKLSVGNNTLLKTVDISNCPNLTSSFDVSGCLNIEEVYAKGSGITSIDLPEAGYVRVLHLPDTIKNLTLKNQLKIEELAFDNYTGLSTLCIDNCPTIDATELLQRCVDSNGKYTLQRVRMTGIEWSHEDASILTSMKDIKGIDEQGRNTDHAYLVGTCHIPKITGQEMKDLRAWYPYLTITFDELSFTASYYNEDGSELVYQYTEKVTNGSSSDMFTILDPVEEGLVDSKYTTKESTVEYKYTYGGWSTVPNSAPQKNALQNIIFDVDRYIAFTQSIQTYTVEFYNGTTLLDTQIVEYSNNASYADEASITKTGTTIPYTFSHWEPSCENIMCDTKCYAQFKLDDKEIHEFTLDEFEFEVNTSNNTMRIMEYKGTSNVGKILPYYNYEGCEYAVTEIGGFSGKTIAYIIIPDTVNKIGVKAFLDCVYLEEVLFPEKVCSTDSSDVLLTLSESSFSGCKLLSNIQLPTNTGLIGHSAFLNCTQLKEIILPETVTELSTMSIYGCSGITSIVIPASVTYVNHFAFKGCSKLSLVTFKGIPSHGIHIEAFADVGKQGSVDFYVPWSMGTVANASWGATNFNMHYNANS